MDDPRSMALRLSELRRCVEATAEAAAALGHEAGSDCAATREVIRFEERLDAAWTRLDEHLSEHVPIDLVPSPLGASIGG